MDGRAQSRLQRARENGYLDACCKQNAALIHEYGRWCWRVRIPMVWLEPRTRYSRYRRVKLEMFTSANRLTPEGLHGMKAICAPGNAAAWTRVSPHDAAWDHVAMASARELAHTVFRAAVRPSNYARNDVRVENRAERKTGNVLRMASA